MDADERNGFARAMAAIVSGIVEGSMETKVAARRLRAGADWLEDISGTGPTPAQVREVFEHWQAETGHTGTKLTDDRRAKIKARLRSRPVEALKAVITWAVRDQFYSKCSTIETLFRSPGKFENYLVESGWLGRSTAPSGCVEQIQLEPPEPEKPRVPLSEFLAENPELAEKAKRLKGILGTVSEEPPTMKVDSGPTSIGEIIAGSD